MSFWRPGDAAPQQRDDDEHHIEKKLNKKKKVGSVSDEASILPTPVAAVKLSTGTLAMKFMSRKKELEERVSIEKERQDRILESQWILNPSKLGEGHRARGLVCLPDEPEPAALPARRSFGGFNPIVQEWSQSSAIAHRMAVHEEVEAREQVGNEEMVDRLEKYVGLRGKGVKHGPDRHGAHKNSKKPKR